MTTSTPPAWKWRDECAVPLATDPCSNCGGSHKPWVLCHEYAQMREEALSIHSHQPPDSDAFRERNDSNQDPTYQDCWPSERYPSDPPGCASVQSGREAPTNLRVGARNEHPECDCTAQVTDSVINAAPEHPACDVSQTGNFPVTGNIDPTCAVTARKTTSPADSCLVESCPECGGVTDIDYGETDNPLLNHMECTFNSCMDIAVAKNEGYAGSADPMANFNDSVRLGVPVPIGVALRLSDKWARLCRLLQTGENPLADESITDTIMDAVNYLAILLYSLEDEGR